MKPAKLSAFGWLRQRLSLFLLPAAASLGDIEPPLEPEPRRDFLRPEERATWADRLRQLLEQLEREPGAEPGMHEANHATVERTLGGNGPDSVTKRTETGARVVINMSSLHVPAFCRHGYMNAYDLQAARAVQAGKALHQADAPRISQRRERVDKALPTSPLVQPRDIYFGAAELNGAGMRYYGDICLVLKSDAVSPSTTILDRNSFDVDRPPAFDRVSSQPPHKQHDARAKLLKAWSGTWGIDLAAMTTIRMHAMGQTRARRWTPGHVGRTIVDDEDYIEVLKHGGFSARDVQEARLSSADTALDAWIAGRVGQAVPPRFEELIWRKRRTEAELALRDAGIPVRVVTHLGRARD